MDEPSTNTAATTTNIITTPSTSHTNPKTSISSSSSNSSSSSSSSGANNMETKSINIPTNVQHAENTSSGSSIISTSISKSTEATTSQTQSGLSNTSTTTRTTQEAVENVSGIDKSSVGRPTPNENVNTSEQAIVHRGENGECDSSQPPVENTATAETNKSSGKERSSDNQNEPNNTNPIDLAKDSTNPLLLSDHHQTAPTSATLSSSSPSTTTIVSSSAPEKVTTVESDSSSNSSKGLRTQGEEIVQEVDTKGANNSSSSSSAKPPVPNFRVEGSGAGDSSITVAVASLSSAVSASVTLHSSGTRAGSTGGSNSLENGEQPGSSSGPVSIQSSEEMRLSLVSWYSEPGDDPSRLIEGCCSALNTYRHEGEIAEEVVGIGDRDICGSSSSMGQEAVSSVTNSSPACKSESEEKENKTPEPCGNLDKMKSAEDEDDTNGTLSKKEFIYLSSNDNAKKADCDTNISSSNNTTNNICNQEESNKCQTLVNKLGDSDSVSGSVAKTNANNSVKSCTEHSKSIKQITPSSQKSKAHVHMSEHKHSSGSSLSHSAPSTGGGGGHTSRCQQEGSNRSAKPECPRCSRRSKSGTTTPASGSQVARTRTPASRRVVQSSKSSTEIKKPIKSILKHDSRGSAGSGSGSDKQSSMDSLGSSGDIGVTPIHLLRGRIPNALMTRSDSGTRARFNFNSVTCTPETPTGTPEDKVVSKLKRIEKYATLRVRKSLKPRPLDLSDSETQSNDVHNGVSSSGTGGRTGVPGVPNELMSKSMSYLEKSSSNRVHISSTHGHPYGESHSNSSTLKRQGSLRLKKPSTPQWEPTGTKTSKLRLQKMQAATGKSSSGGGGSGGGGGASSGSANSGSAHSGSGDSLHYLPHSANTTSTAGSSYGSRGVHLVGAHSAPTSHSRMAATVAAKEKHMGAKIFSKLSSALGQTASSNQKRIRQERGVQTEVLVPTASHERMSLSPVPAVDTGAETTEQIKNLERLCNRYRNQVMKIQSDYEQSEYKKTELMKELEEKQVESNEMIEFLQAEKSTLAESLTEVEVEAKKWKDEIEAVKRDYQSRCSSLVRLSEQHKQEALKSQALLHRLESQSTTVISQLSHQIADGAQGIYTTRQRVNALTDSLLKTYRVPPELLASSETNQAIKETDLSCSLLLPLITSLSAAFPMVPMDSLAAKSYTTTGNSTTPSSSSYATLGHMGSPPSTTDCEVASVTVKVTEPPHNMLASQCTSLTLTESTSLQSLNQAILEREAAEKSGLDDIMKPFSLFEGVSPDADQLSLRKEITELNAAIAKLLNVVKIILINSDKKVSSVASSILQCLKSIEDDKVGNMAEIAQVQKSLEAWSEKGMSEKENSSGSTSSSNGSPPCKTTVTSSTVGGSPPSYLVGNGHAHV